MSGFVVQPGMAQDQNSRHQLSSAGPQPPWYMINQIRINLELSGCKIHIVDKLHHVAWVTFCCMSCIDLVAFCELWSWFQLQWYYGSDVEWSWNANITKISPWWNCWIRDCWCFHRYHRCQIRRSSSSFRLEEFCRIDHRWNRPDQNDEWFDEDPRIRMTSNEQRWRLKL